MNHFCTITTLSHWYKTMALFDSILHTNPDSTLHVLCIEPLPANLPQGNIFFYSLNELATQPSAQTILSKYQSSMDKTRWCFKPVFLRYLIEKVAEKVIYLDNDIYLYSDAAFLFNLLDNHSVLLTPHHYPRDPAQGQNWLEANFKVGLYNAGFVGVNRAAVSTLEWWAACCAYRCEKNPLRGTFDDQKYLDLVPIMNETAYIVRHKGCNVADWNRAVISRTIQDGRVVLDRKDELVFIHFNNTTIRAILTGNEPCLKPAFDVYFENLQKYNPAIQPTNLYHKDSWLNQFKYHIWKVATDLGF